MSIEIDAPSLNSPESPFTCCTPRTDGVKISSVNLPRKERMSVKGKRKKKNETMDISFEESGFEKARNQEELKVEAFHALEFGDKLGFKRKESEETIKSNLEQLEKRDRISKKGKVKKSKKDVAGVIQ